MNHHDTIMANKLIGVDNMEVIEVKIQYMKEAIKKLLASGSISDEDEKELREIYTEVCSYFDPCYFDETKQSNILDSRIYSIAYKYDVNRQIGDTLDSWEKHFQEDTENKT